MTLNYTSPLFLALLLVLWAGEPVRRGFHAVLARLRADPGLDHVHVGVVMPVGIAGTLGHEGDRLSVRRPGRRKERR